MSVIEIAFLHLINDPSSIDRHWPAITSKLITPNPGIVTGGHGVISYQNDQSVQDDDLTKVLVIEWRDQRAFYDFANSDQAKTFQHSIKPLLRAPPDLEMYNADRPIPAAFGSKEVVEIVRVSVPDADDYERVRSVWMEDIGLEEAVLCGTNFNKVDKNLFIGVLLWNSFEEQASVEKQWVTPLSAIGEVSTYVLPITPIAL
ncbi:hypothetical protein BGW36DRAFT_387343 [Talaromyces proteolyticus]|uniref:ABM domain-containing protein n=1 Tax=Talaromyces proteolyticus TaxID=1131652 RepID=A0AAD4KN96_9EURO|nr:uncharacterized protein BGW36DRAFT_387343 [Talaromyces proteolyticus]KAH8692297.1 hypothetical protein BGW36DRAFT_387343 [Talaromyces proteolyticus]